MKKVGFVLAGVCALGIIASQTLGKDAAPAAATVSVPAEEAAPTVVPDGLPVWHGASAPFWFDTAVDNRTFNIVIHSSEPGEYAASMRFADDRGRLLKLYGGDCKSIDSNQKLTAELGADAVFEYATVYTQIYRGDECEDIYLVDGHAAHLKNENGNVRIIGDEEFYLNSSINGEYIEDEGSNQ